MAAALGSSAPANADPAAACRLFAAAAFSNTLDAFENEMRQQAYLNCMTRQHPAIPTVSAPRVPTHPTHKSCMAYLHQLSVRQMIGPSGQAYDGCMKGEAWTG